MLLTSEGDYLVCGYLDRVDFGSHFSETDVYAALVSEEGTIIWERTFGGSCQDWARYCVEVEDGFIIAGQSCSDDGDLTVNNGGEDLWIIKLSADGELLWQKTVGETTLDSVVDMVKTQDSGFAVLGKSLQKAFTEDDGSPVGYILHKFSDLGELQWSRQVLDLNSDNFGIDIYDFYQNDKGGYLFGGTIKDYTIGLPHSNYVIGLSNSGDELWKKEYLNSVDTCYSRNVEIFSDNEFIFAGGCNTDGYNGWVMRTDSLGEILWSKNFGGLGTEEVRDVTILENGHVLGVGITTSNDVGLDEGRTNLLFFELDEEGQLAWYDINIGSGYPTGYKIIQTNNDGILISVFSQDLSLIKLSPSLSSTALPDPTSTLRLYPNPTTDKITIEVEPEEIGSSFTIYDMTGQRISFGEIETTKTILSTMDFPIGTFIIKLGEDSQILRHFVKN